MEQLTFAEGWHEAPEGKIAVRWERTEEGIRLNVQAPEGLYGRIYLPQGYLFAEDRLAVKPLCSGSYAITAG